MPPKKSVEDTYKKMSQHEHILSRPDTYIGTIAPVQEDQWVFDETTKLMVLRKLTWVPGLFKIFDEILVNAADNKVRDPSQTKIEVVIDRDEGFVSVLNDGDGIPVEKHKDHNLWVPELIFGHLLTSSNYDDDEAKVTGGRNGYGAKLTNVFSRKFVLETVCRGKRFKMKWTGNMLKKEEPTIDRVEKSDYTKVTFYPDFQRFGLAGFDDDIVDLMKRRVYDIAGCTDKSLKVKFNNERVPVESFADYVALYPTLGEDYKKNTLMRINERWEVAVRLSNIGYQQISFVNSIATTRGGTHVKYIVDQICDKVAAAVAKKRKDVDVKPHMIRPHIWVFINCLIENPGFDSQTKETLNTPRTKFGSTCVLPETMIDAILKSGIVERTVMTATDRLTRELASKVKAAERGRITGIPKLEDANDAGTKNSALCTLILTEGDSAKALAVSGLAVVGRDRFGVFPLRGKPLNVRDAGKKVMNCEEIQAIIKIMGLKVGQKYTDVSQLRYGRLMIMADQDHDGSHIKGLLINFIHYFWPTLLAVPGFVTQFITPIVKALPTRKSDPLGGRAFYSIPDFLEWKRSLSAADAKRYSFKYYKGLGTSTSAEGRDYFQAIDKHQIIFQRNAIRPSEDDDAIVMAFAKDKVAERKEWITNFSAMDHVGVDFRVKRQTYKEFIDKELILFSVADCERSIPNVIDGLKPGQRKILFSCFLRNLTKSIKVAQLAGYTSEKSAYHHGEASLNSTIVGLAQDYVGSNNVPLLVPDGQFGTRHQGGKDHASARYIFTCLNPITRLLYPKSDDYLLDYKDDDGFPVEPHFYVPVIPTVLLNGTTGIGTGFATSIPNYSPFDIIDNVRRLLDGTETEAMIPWYYGFSGTIEQKPGTTEKGKFVSRGKFRIDNGIVSVTDLPIESWTNGYKKFLEDLIERELVLSFRENHTDITVDFDIAVHPVVLQKWLDQDAVAERLNLIGHVHASNIIAFDRHEKLAKFSDPEAVIKEFFVVRMEYYQKRKDYLVGELKYLVSKLENTYRFVQEVVNGTLVVSRKKKSDLLADLRSRNYLPFPPVTKKKVSAGAVEGVEGEDETRAHDGNDDDTGAEDIFAKLSAAGRRNAAAVNNASAPSATSREDALLEQSARDYDYLLGLRLWNLTHEMLLRLDEQMKNAQSELRILLGKTAKDLWNEDLVALEDGLKKYFDQRRREAIETFQKRKPKARLDIARMRIPTLADKILRQLEQQALQPKTIAERGRRKAQKEGADEAVPLVGEDGEVIVGEPTEVKGKRPRAKRAAAGAAGAGKKKTKKTTKKEGSDDDDDDDDGKGDDDDGEKPKRGRRGGGGAAAAGSRGAKKGGAGGRKKRPSSDSEDAEEAMMYSSDDDDEDDDSSSSDSSDSDSSSEFSDDDEDSNFARKARRVEDDDDERKTSNKNQKPAAAPKKKAAAGAGAKKTKNGRSAAGDDDEDDDDVTFGSLVGKSKKPSPKKPATGTKASSAAAAASTSSAKMSSNSKQTSTINVDDDDIFDLDNFGIDALPTTSKNNTSKPKSAVIAATAATASSTYNKPATSLLDDDDELLLLGSQTSPTSPSPREKKASAAPGKKSSTGAKASGNNKKTQPKKKRGKDSDDDDDDDDFLASESSDDDSDSSSDSDDDSDDESESD